MQFEFTVYTLSLTSDFIGRIRNGCELSDLLKSFELATIVLDLLLERQKSVDNKISLF